MTAVTEASLLTAWEAAVDRPRRDRALALAQTVSELGADDLADLPLGEVDALLLDLRERCFGTVLDCLISCPHCAEELDAVVDVAELRFPVSEERMREVSVGDGSIVVRAVTSRDLRVTGDRESLLRRCVLVGEVAADSLGLVENILDELDPQAAPVVELDCPACQRTWVAPFDVVEFVWQEVDRCARRTLNDVHVLAAAYGWREGDVLALSPVRRSYYLQAAGS
jgi:hypothetical protein